MLALDPTVVEAVWQSFAAYLPERGEAAIHSGCHRPRRSDRDCFEAILFRLVTGCSWDVAGRLGEGSETTLRRRRDEWVAAGAFEHLVNEAIAAFDKVIGLDLSEVSIDGSLHKAPAGGEGTGPNPIDRGKTGWKWSVATDTNGVPIGWVIDGANRNDSSCSLRPSTTSPAAGCSPTSRPWLDRGYDSDVTRTRLAERGIDDPSSPRSARGAQPKAPRPAPRHALAGRADELMALQLRSAAAKHRPIHRHRLAQFALAVALIITVKLVKWSKRWGPSRLPNGASSSGT